MRIGIMIDVDRPIDEVLAQVQGFADDGFASAWAIQVFGYDALTLLAVVGNRVPGIGLGTAVVPIYGRHPQVMAQQALTVQAHRGGRLTLGIGLSHQMVVENLWGVQLDTPARHMREYLSPCCRCWPARRWPSRARWSPPHTYAPLEIPGAPAAAGPGGRPRAGHARTGRPGGGRHGHLDDRDGGDRRPHRPDHHRSGRSRPAARPRGWWSACPSP